MEALKHIQSGDSPISRIEVPRARDVALPNRAYHAVDTVGILPAWGACCMRSEEILLREAEYRAMREALGAYDVALVLAESCPRALPEASVSDSPQGLVGTLSSRTPLSRLPGGGESQARKDSR